MRSGRCSIATTKRPQVDPASILEFARLVIDALESARVPYLLGGSLASAVWGEPRSTLDVDFVVSLRLERIGTLSRALEQRSILIPADVMLSQLEETRGDVAIVGYHLQTGFKAELFPLRPGDALRESALARRVRIDLGPPLGRIYVHTAEDLILYKLLYFDLSAQTKHVRDIVSILLSRATDLDYGYLTTWVQQLGLAVAWQLMLVEARRLGASVPSDSGPDQT